MKRVVFYLMNEKGLHVLMSFVEKFSGEKIEYVVLSEDKSVQKDYYDELTSLCNKHSILYFNRKDNIPKFEGYKFAIGWRWIIDDTSNLIVLHDSILPKYRGFSPLVNMMINGEDEIGVTALFASNEYDKGQIIKQEKVNITYPIKIQEAIQRISPLYSKLVNYISDLIFDSKEIIGIPQDEKSATYSLWRDEQDYFIDWNCDSTYIRRKVDAVGYPYGGARTYLNNEIVIVEEVEEYGDLNIENRDVGKVIFVEHGYPVIVCGEGLLKVTKASDINGDSILPLKSFRIRFKDSK